MQLQNATHHDFGLLSGPHELVTYFARVRFNPLRLTTRDLVNQYCVSDLAICHRQFVTTIWWSKRQSAEVSNGLEAEVARLRERLGKCAEKRLGFRDLGGFRRRQKAFDHTDKKVLGFERVAGRMIELRQR
jgi:hypothetical protein